MKYSWSTRILLVSFLGAFALILTHTPDRPAASSTAASGATLKWDETFADVVHDEKNIAGFVAEYRWLSNYFACRIEWEGRVYGSAEAAYHSGKYPAAEREVFTKLDADRARKLSRARPYDSAAWETRRIPTMRAVVWAKFWQNPDLAKKLVATGDRYLAEVNWWGDKIWGVYRGDGRNLLGKILMDTRARLVKEGTFSRRK